ncbi:MAG TPA: cupin domain-containing protein [Terriglobia bacterium]
MDTSRRELCLMLPALLASPPQAAGAANPPLPSKVYRFEALPVETTGQNQFRAVLEGTTHEGCRVALHETDLGPGAAPHPPHHHAHEEVFLIREGTLEVTINGQSSSFGPGSVAYIASNDQHSIRNTGQTHAQYFVLELGTRS